MGLNQKSVSFSHFSPSNFLCLEMARPVTSGRGRAPLREGEGKQESGVEKSFDFHTIFLFYPFLGLTLPLASDRRLTEKESIESVASRYKNWSIKVKTA